MDHITTSGREREDKLEQTQCAERGGGEEDRARIILPLWWVGTPCTRSKKKTKTKTPNPLAFSEACGLDTLERL